MRVLNNVPDNHCSAIFKTDQPLFLELGECELADLPQVLLSKHLLCFDGSLQLSCRTLSTQQLVNVLGAVGRLSCLRDLSVGLPREFLDLNEAKGQQGLELLPNLHRLLQALQCVAERHSLTKLGMGAFPVHASHIPLLDSIFQTQRHSLKVLVISGRQWSAVPSLPRASMAVAAFIAKSYDASAQHLLFRAVSRLKDLTVLQLMRWQELLGTDTQSVKSVVAPLMRLNGLQKVVILPDYEDDIAALTAELSLPFERISIVREPIRL